MSHVFYLLPSVSLQLGPQTETFLLQFPSVGILGGEETLQLTHCKGTWDSGVSEHSHSSNISHILDRYGKDMVNYKLYFSLCLNS